MSCPTTEARVTYAAILDTYTADADHLCVAWWVLEQMTDTFLELAFATACDECDEAGPEFRHPRRPGPGGNYGDAMPEPAPEVRRAAERAALLLYADILTHYDPAPALLRWWGGDAGAGVEGNEVSAYWRERFSPLRAAAACWGHYAVMSAVGHGVNWSDDNEPLTDAKGAELPYPGGRGMRDVSAEDIPWSDEYTDAARMEIDARADEARAANDVDG